MSRRNKYVIPAFVALFMVPGGGNFFGSMIEPLGERLNMRTQVIKEVMAASLTIIGLSLIPLLLFW